MTAPATTTGVLKHGIGYDLVVNRSGARLVLGIRCHVCDRTSYNPNDIERRYCGNCHVFYDDRPRGAE